MARSGRLWMVAAGLATAWALGRLRRRPPRGVRRDLAPRGGLGVAGAGLWAALAWALRRELLHGGGRLGRGGLARLALGAAARALSPAPRR